MPDHDGYLKKGDTHCTAITLATQKNPPTISDPLPLGSQAGVGWLSWSVAKSLRAFVESVFANSRVKNVVFTIPAKQAIYSCQYTGAVIG